MSGDQADQTTEKDQFLNGAEANGKSHATVVKIEDGSGKSQKKNPNSRSRSSCCCGCCGWKCCGLTSLFFVLVVVAVLLIGYFRYQSRLTGTASSADSAEWAKKLAAAGNSNLTAAATGSEEVYKLVSFDENYGDYLSAFGVPFFAIGMVKSSSEIITIKRPEEVDGLWSWNIKTDLRETRVEFRVGEEFLQQYGRGDKQFTKTCVWLDANVLECSARDEKRDVTLVTRNRFSPAGLIEELELGVQDKVKTKKYFQKVTREDLAKEKEQQRKEDAAKDLPFSIDDEDEEDFWEDNMDDDDW